MSQLLTDLVPLIFVLKKKKKMHKLFQLEVWNQTDLKDEKGRNYNNCYWCNEDSFKGLQEIDGKMELDLTIEIHKK